MENGNAGIEMAGHENFEAHSGLPVLWIYFFDI